MLCYVCHRHESAGSSVLCDAYFADGVVGVSALDVEPHVVPAALHRHAEVVVRLARLPAGEVHRELGEGVDGRQAPDERRRSVARVGALSTRPRVTHVRR